jgi:hypothetical protein
MHYMQDRGMAKTEGRKVWAFLGDGETDEPETLGAITMAGLVHNHPDMNDLAQIPYHLHVYQMAHARNDLFKSKMVMSGCILLLSSWSKKQGSQVLIFLLVPILLM